jgi:hypothetical protein
VSTDEELQLLQWEQVVSLLQIPDTDVQWLVDTRQLTELLIHGHQRFYSRDIDLLIDAYRGTARRRAQ